MGYELAADRSEVFFHVFVKAPHDRLVKAETRFWNASGINVSMGADGVDVQMESLQSLLTGGIAFDTPAYADSDPPAKEGTPFALHANRAAIGEAAITEEYPFLAYFTGSVRGLSIGAPVEFKGIRIGSVKDIRLELGKTPEEDRVEVTFAIEPQRVTLAGERPFESPYVGIGGLIEQGLRAQLQSGSLITGALFLGLEYHPEAAPAEYKKDGKYPEVPTIPTDFEMISRSLTSVLEKVAALPLDGLVEDMRKMVQSTEKLINSPDVRQSVKSLRETAAAAQATLKQAESTLASADSLIGPKSQLRYDAVQMMKELRGAARSIRVLTDYLERHPEALIQGKGGG
jgi:paraquat-inducible protein B